MEVIAKIKTDFPDKFGIPRQSGLIENLRGKIIFEPEYRNPDAIRGLEEFSHIWLIWEFSEMKREVWSPTVRPPRLGGNTRVGVFATRSPNRPNPIGLSSVRIEKIEFSERYGPLIYVLGADMMDNTPIYDIKPYIPYADCHKDAKGGFAETKKDYALEVKIPQKLIADIDKATIEALTEVLSQDPRPSYQNDSDRVYGMRFAGYEVKFKVLDCVLCVCDIKKGER